MIFNIVSEQVSTYAAPGHVAPGFLMREHNFVVGHVHFLQLRHVQQNYQEQLV